MPLQPDYHVWAAILPNKDGQRTLRLTYLGDDVPSQPGQACCIYFCGQYRIFCFWAEGKMPDLPTCESLAPAITSFVLSQRS